MGFYRKRLNGIDDLERERKALRKEREELEQEEFFSLKDLFGAGKSRVQGKSHSEDNTDDKEKDAGIAGLESLLGLLPTAATPLLSILTGMLENTVGIAVGKKGKHIALKLAREVIVGYLKWKAVELGYKGAKHLIKKKKEKREGQ